MFFKCTKKKKIIFWLPVWEFGNGCAWQLSTTLAACATKKRGAHFSTSTNFYSQYFSAATLNKYMIQLEFLN